MTLRLMYVLTLPQSALGYLKGQLRNMRDRGYDVIFVASDTGHGGLAEVARRENVRVQHLEISREIDLFRDLQSMWHMSRVLRKERPDIINFGNPKSSLVGSVTAWLHGTPVRIYTLHGLRLETARGLKWAVLYLAELVTMACAHQVVAVSPSLRTKALALRLTRPSKIQVLGSGSVNGVASVGASPLPKPLTRTDLGIPDGDLVIGFVGRFTHDKGMRELLQAFTDIKRRSPQVSLLLVGDFEEGDPVDAATRRAIQQQPSIYRPGFVNDVTPYYPLMDLLVLPSHREGLGVVALEAAAAGLPVVTTTATGARDAVLHGRTGLQVRAGDVQALTQAIQTLVESAELRRAYGDAGRAWVSTAFDQQAVWDAWEDLYQTLTWRRADSPGGARLARPVAALILAGWTWRTLRRRRTKQ